MEHEIIYLQLFIISQIITYATSNYLIENFISGKKI